MIKVCAAVFLIIIIPLAASRILMRMYLRRYDMSELSFSLRTEDMQGRYAPRRVSFRSGENQLCGYIFGEDTDGGLVIFCHGLFGGAAEYFAFAQHFVDIGLAVFMFDNTGCNESGGKSIKGPLQGLRDLNAAIKYLKASESALYSRKKALVGHSWGGFTVAAFRKTEDIDCIISLAGFDRAAPAICDFIVGTYGKWLKVLLPYCYLFLLMQYGRAFNTSAVKNINSNNRPYLIVQGTNDKIIHYKGSSLYNHRDKVTNPNVKFILRTDKLHNKHNTIFRDADATAYMEGRYALMREARSITDKKLRRDACRKVFEGTDRFAVNRLDPEFVEMLDDMLTEYVK